MAIEIKRDSFTLPITDLELIQKIKKRCMLQGIDINKSEIVRAGIHALAKMDENELKKNADDIPKYRAGRPSSAQKS